MKQLESVLLAVKASDDSRGEELKLVAIDGPNTETVASCEDADLSLENVETPGTPLVQDVLSSSSELQANGTLARRATAPVGVTCGCRQS